MSIHGKPLSEITESDLQRLIDDKVRESQTLEFKQEVYGRADDPTREMLRDILAMANAFGGDLLIGVEEDEDGIAVNLLGVENADKEADRMVSSCLSNIAERLPGLSTQPVPLANGRQVIIFRIPRSLRAPHMVTFKGLNQCWIRHDRQKSPMSIHEIKDTCLKIDGLMEKLERFLEKRKREVLEEIGSSSYYIVSVTPVFVDTEVVDIRDSYQRNLLQNPPGIRPSGWCVPSGETPRPTLHGLKVEIADEKSVELYRNGHVELIVNITKDHFFSPVELGEGTSTLFLPWPLGEYPLSLLRLSKAIYAHLGLTDPVAVSLALYNISGFRLWPNTNDPRSPRFLGNRMKSLARMWRKPNLEIRRTEVPSLEVPEQVAREMADRIWQAFGHEQTPLFDDSGNFVAS